MQSARNDISREERELLTYFRALPVQQQLDILSHAETEFNSFERMRQLATRQVEHRGSEGEHEWH